MEWERVEIGFDGDFDREIERDGILVCARFDGRVDREVGEGHLSRCIHKRRLYELGCKNETRVYPEVL